MKIELTIEATVIVVTEFDDAKPHEKPVLRETLMCLEVQSPLIKSAYVKPDGRLTEAGSRATTAAHVAALVSNIHDAEENGFKPSATHLREIIAKLEEGFAFAGSSPSDVVGR